MNFDYEPPRPRPTPLADISSSGPPRRASAEPASPLPSRAPASGFQSFDSFAGASDDADIDKLLATAKLYSPSAPAAFEAAFARDDVPDPLGTGQGQTVIGAGITGEQLATIIDQRLTIVLQEFLPAVTSSVAREIRDRIDQMETLNVSGYSGVARHIDAQFEDLRSVLADVIQTAPPAPLAADAPTLVAAHTDALLASGNSAQIPLADRIPLGRVLFGAAAIALSLGVGLFTWHMVAPSSQRTASSQNLAAFAPQLDSCPIYSRTSPPGVDIDEATLAKAAASFHTSVNDILRTTKPTLALPTKGPITISFHSCSE